MDLPLLVLAPLVIPLLLFDAWRLSRPNGINWINLDRMAERAKMEKAVVILWSCVFVFGVAALTLLRYPDREQLEIARRATLFFGLIYFALLFNFITLRQRLNKFG